MRKTRLRRVGAVVLGLSLVAAACGGDDDDESTGTDVETTAAASTETTAAPETTEAAAEETTTSAAASGDTEGALAGMKGTTPLVKLSDDFVAQLQETPTAKATPFTDPNYAGETYDAITIVALATEIAKSDGIEYASEIQGVTRDGEKCADFASCKALIDAGTDIDYDGKSGNITLNGVGEPQEASYGVLTFGDTNRILDGQEGREDTREYIPATASAAADVPPVAVEGTRAGDGVLKIGGLLPQTGSLAFLGPPEFAGAELAIADINEAGGVLGVPVEWLPGDSGDTSTDIASQTTDRLLGENVDAIIGAASSSVSLTVIDKIVAAGVVQFSPANTSNAFTDYPDKGLYFRVAPPDVLQGNLIGQLVADDGNSSAYILALDDAYGTSLAEVITDTLEQSGVELVGTKIYDPKATSFDAEVDEIKSLNPDAIVLITFDEGSRILRTMVEAGIGPSAKNVYGCDGNMGNALGENFDTGK
ncbi:MAG: ABC transporter substrate-binding protein [Acidimicrobiia bacterium]